MKPRPDSQTVNCPKLLDSFAPDIRQCLTALISNSRSCQHWLSAEPPNTREARAAAERMVRNANALAELVNPILEKALRFPGTPGHNE
jgi:hypothetical protein